jgi:membrane protein implicated in regulation of membrane protease activity
VSLIIQITKGVIRDQSTRRALMFGVVLIALLMLFVGATFLSGHLAGKPLMFIAYWVVCGWLTLLAVLLAIYDLVAVRAKAAHERRKLRQKVFGEHAEREK